MRLRVFLRRRRGSFVPLGAALVVVAGASASCGSGDDAATGPNANDGGAAGSPTPTPASGSIGSSGGTVASSDGTSVSIPAGALSTTQTITVTPDPTAPLGSGFVAVGTPYIFGPEGLTFTSPATVTLDMTPSSFPAGKTASDVHVYTAPVGSTAFATLPTTLRDATHVTAPTMHFSIFVPGIATGASATDDGGASTDGGDAGTDGGSMLLPDGGTVDTVATPNETAGTRLHPMYRRSDFGDGARTLARIGMYDEQRQEPCEAMQMSDGKFYCAPAGWTANPSYTGFVDAACTQPLVVLSPPAQTCNDVAPAQPNHYLLTADYVTCGQSNHLFSAPAASRLPTGTVYQLAGTAGCLPVTFDATTYEGYPKSALTEVPLSELVALTTTNPTVTGGTGRLHAAPTVWSGADGSRWTVDGNLVDSQSGDFCTLAWGSDKLQRCLPMGLAFYDYVESDYYADSACTQVAENIPLGTSCLAPDARNATTIATGGGGYDSDSCFDLNMVDVSADVPLTEVYSKDGACTELPAPAIDDSNRYCSGPAPTFLPITNFVSVTETTKDAASYGVSGARIHPENVHQIGDEGSDVTQLATEPVDTQSGLACTPMTLTDGMLHCVPPSRPFQHAAGPSSTPAYYFTDAACTDPLVRVPSASADCARARGSLVYTEVATTAGCGTVSVYRATAAPLASGTPLYTSNGTSCGLVANNPTGQYWHLADMVKADPSEFVLESLSIETR